MPTRRFRILSALCGVLGVSMVIVSFNLNPGPPANASTTQVMAWGRQYLDSIMLGSWLQAVGSFLSVVFAVAIVHMAGATTRFWGVMTVFGCIVLVGVSLLEVTFYLGAVQGGGQRESNDCVGQPRFDQDRAAAVSHAGGAGCLLSAGCRHPRLTRASAGVGVPVACSCGRLRRLRGGLPFRAAPGCGRRSVDHAGGLVPGRGHHAPRPYTEGI